MLDLSEKASRAQVNARYLSLMSSKWDEKRQQKATKTYTDTDNDEGIDCNLNKLIKDLTRDRLFTINDSDRAEIITKAYNLIMGTEANEQRSPGNAPGSAKIGDYVSWGSDLVRNCFNMISWEVFRIPPAEKK